MSCDIPWCLSQRNSSNVKLLNFINCSYRQRPFTGYSKTGIERGKKSLLQYRTPKWQSIAICMVFLFLNVSVLSNRIECSTLQNWAELRSRSSSFERVTNKEKLFSKSNCNAVTQVTYIRIGVNDSLNREKKPFLGRHRESLFHTDTKSSIAYIMKL